MPEPQSNPGADRAQQILVAVIVGMVATVIVAVPAGIGIGLWYSQRRRLARGEYALIAGGGLLALALVGRSTIPAYFRWLVDGKSLIADKDFGWILRLPVLDILPFVAITWGVVGFVMQSKLRDVLMARIGRAPKEDVSVVPTDVEKARIAQPAPDGLLVTPDAHSLDGEAPVGKRPFYIGVDRHGSPAALTETEIGTHAIILGSTGSGKALALDTPIPTPQGWTTMGALKVGDQVFDENGNPCNVTFATEVQYDRDCYEVVFSDGSVIVADAEHRWLTDTAASRASAARAALNERHRLRRPGDHRDQRHKRTLPAVVTTEEIRATLTTFADRRANHSIPVAGPVRWERKTLPVDPYMLGVWLGDGSSRHGGITSADPEVIDEIRDAGYDIHPCPGLGPYGWYVAGLLGDLRDLGVLTPTARDLRARSPRVNHQTGGHKHIPELYLTASPDQRLALLQGLMDSDGHVTKTGTCEYVSTSEALAKDVRRLVSSLGIQATLRTKEAKFNGKPCGTCWTVAFTTDQHVARLPRKVERLPKRVRNTTRQRYIVDVRPVPSVPVRCIQVDSSQHLYLAGDTCIPTHNTETIKNVIGNLADLGWNVVLIDLKEDTKEGGLRDFCSVYAREHALRYQELALSSPHPTYWFNPLYGMSYDEAINTLMSLQDFDDGYWQAVNKTMIGQLVTLFYDAHAVDPEKYPAPDMYTMGHLLRQPDLKAATKEMVAKVVSSIPGRSTADFSAFVKPSDDERKSAAGLGSRIINMFESEAGRRTLRPGPGRETMDVTAKGVCYIGLNTLGLSELARVVSTSALLRLSAYAGARTTGAAEIDGSRTAVIIDEANWIDRRQVQNLLSRARSAGISVWLCTQGPQDWSDENGDDWNKIVNNVNVGILMRQGSEEAAVMCADFVGKRKQTSLMSQIRDGELTESGSLREAYEHVVTPDQFRTLRIGEAVVKVNVPEDRLAWVKVALRDPAAKPRTASRRRSHGRP